MCKEAKFTRQKAIQHETGKEAVTVLWSYGVHFLLRGSVRTLPVNAFHIFTFRENIRGQKITPNRLQSQAGRAVCGGPVSSSCVC